MSSQQAAESNTALAAATTESSQSATPGPSIGKLIRRFTTKKDGSKRFSIFNNKAGSSSTEEAKGDDAAAEDAKDSSAKPQYENVQTVSKIDIHTERARLLGQRFGLEFDLSQWQSTEGTVLRVEKPIRMRVRRTCHVCNATFGKDRECPECKHQRCTKCIRSPPRRSEAERAATREHVQARLKDNRGPRPGCGYIVPDTDPCPKKFPPLTRQPKCPTQDLIYKKPRQRIRRTCHICNSLFHGSDKECETCCHIRCTDCPRDPPKREKYPYGYPGDAWGPTAVPHHKCHACKKVFPGGVHDGTACEECGHRKCPRCLRMKPQKVEAVLDPEVLARITASFAKLELERAEAVDA